MHIPILTPIYKWILSKLKIKEPKPPLKIDLSNLGDNNNIIIVINQNDSK